MALAGNGGAVNERAVDVQVNRLRRKIERDPANPLLVQTVRGIGYRLVIADAMTSARRRHRAAALGGDPRRPTAGTASASGSTAFMPKGLYARALLIIIAPMVILQSVVAFVFMERHWNLVTQRLSAAVVQDIAALIDVYKSLSAGRRPRAAPAIAQERLGLVVDFLPVDRHAAAGAEAVLLAARPGAVGGDRASRSAGRSGSTRSAARRWSRSASSSTTR